MWGAGYSRAINRPGSRLLTAVTANLLFSLPNFLLLFLSLYLSIYPYIYLSVSVSVSVSPPPPLFSLSSHTHLPSHSDYMYALTIFIFVLIQAISQSRSCILHLSQCLFWAPKFNRYSLVAKALDLRTRQFRIQREYLRLMVHSGLSKPVLYLT